ncbi:MAG TPA: DUF6597 domain-containing transcriptional factor, partial [Bryobacteraceae bacterium]|nr:DUF6597 domain-containing transcriptional factor [Bryobacteraceae bacterium]
MIPYREHAPPPAMARWIECSWSVTTAEPLDGYAVRPDGCLDIVFDREHGLRVVGAMTTEKRYNLAAGSQLAGIRFRPGMAGLFLQAEIPALTDGLVALEDLWGRAGRELENRIVEADSSEECARELMAALTRPGQPLTPTQRAIEAIYAAHGIVDLDEIASQA